MFKGFSQIDLFGKSVLFTYKGNSTSKSKVGAVCTILLCVFIIWLIVYFGETLFDKSHPKATSFESYNENPAPTPLTPDNFAFAIGLADPVTFANYINESIFTAYASTYKTIRTPQADGTVQISYEQVPIELEQCRTDHFGELSDQFSYLALDQLYCLKKEQPNLEMGHPILEGNFESPEYRSIYIYFQECNPNATTVTCGTQGERDKLLKGGYMSLVYSNIAVDLTDAKKPLKMFRDSTYTTVDSAYYKELTLYLEQLEINTDDAWLTTNYKTEDYIKFGEIREFLSLTPKSYFAYFSIRLSNVKQHYNRSYTKLQEIIAQVNGIILVAFTALLIVLAPYARLKFYEALINEIFDIKWFKGNSKEKNLKKKASQISKKSNSKNTEKKNKPKPLAKKVLSQEDLEQQRSISKPQKDLTNNVSELTDGKDRDIEVSAKKRRSSIEELSVQYNSSEIQSPVSSPYTKQKFNLKDSKTQDKKEKAAFFLSKGLPGLVSPRSESENRPINLELSSRLDTPNASKIGGLLSSKKPSFMQPNFKSLDSDNEGQDQFEDILQNVDQDHTRYNKVPIEEYGISRLTSQAEYMISKENKIMTSKDIWPPETVISNNEDEKQKEENGSQKIYSMQKLDAMVFKSSEKINLSFCEYLRSCISKSDAIKEKMYILNEGIQRINERLDIFNLFKKLREFDKLKVLLLESEQFVLFDSLPRPELAFKTKTGSGSADLLSQNQIKDAQFIQDRRKKELILMSYEKMKRKDIPTVLDRKLFEIYDDIFGM